MGGFNQRDVRVRLELTSAFVGDADEGIVQSVQDERWHSDGINNARGCCSVVVVVRSREAGVKPGDAVVKLAQRANPTGAVGIEGVRKQLGLAAKAAQEIVEELQLVEAILRQMQRVGGWSKIDCGRDTDHRTKLSRRRCTEFAGELEDEIATHGVADQRH